MTKQPQMFIRVMMVALIAIYPLTVSAIQPASGIDPVPRQQQTDYDRTDTNEQQPDSTTQDNNHNYPGTKPAAGSAMDYYNQAINLIKQVKQDNRSSETLDAVLELVNKSIELDPDFALAYGVRAKIYLYQQQYELAEQDCTQGIALDGRYDHLFLLRAVAHLYQDHYALALDDINRSLELVNTHSVDEVVFYKHYYAWREGADDFTDHHFLRGWAYFGLNRMDEAITDLTFVIDNGQSKHLVFCYVMRGDCYRQLGDYQAAINDENEAIEHNPGFALAYATRGKIREEQGLEDYALVDYSKAIHLNPRFRVALGARAQLFSLREQLPFALRDFKAVSTLLPDGAKTLIDQRIDGMERKISELTADYIQRGDMLLRQQRYQSAIDYYNRALGLNSLSVQAYTGRAAAYRWLGNLDACVDNCQSALKIDSQYTPALFELAEVSRLRRNFTAALVIYDSIKLQSPVAAEVCLARAQTLEHLQRYEEARQEYREFLRLEQHNREQIQYARRRLEILS